MTEILRIVQSCAVETNLIFASHPIWDLHVLIFYRHTEKLNYIRV